MQNRKYIIGIGLIVLVVIAALVIFRREAPKVVDSGKHERKEIYNYDAKLCPGATVTMKMTDPYLRGLIEEGADVKTIINFYGCNELHRGDVVLYRFSEFNDPVFRRVVAVEGDKYDLSEARDGWELFVNEKKVRGIKGESYLFGGKSPPPLKLTVAHNKGRVPKGQAIVFSSFPPGDRDSGVFGMISKSDLIGKAVLDK